MLQPTTINIPNPTDAYDPSRDDKLEDTPPLPLESPLVCQFATLPSLLKLSIDILGHPQKELLIYSIITVLSGIMTKVKGSYNQRTCYANLFTMVVAPPASGKGVMMYARELIQPIQNHLLKESEKQSKIYKSQLKSGKGNVKGVRPPYKVAIIPANCSSSKLLQHLSDNIPDTPCIIIESEMDTLSITTASDFGNYSDILRKAFHNEPVSQSRRTNDEFITIETPKLVVLISGTPGQLYKFINNREDGLLSRFIVIFLDNNVGWQSVSPCLTCINLTEYYSNLSKEYFKLWEFISTEVFEVKLSPTQWSSLEQYANKKYSEICQSYDENATSIIKRHGLMIFKICMVLTGLRKYEQKSASKVMECTDDDFLTAQYLVNKSLGASLDLFESLPEVKTGTSHKNKKMEIFLSQLKVDFSREDAISSGKSRNISSRTVDRYLNELTQSGVLDHTQAGKYSKRAKF